MSGAWTSKQTWCIMEGPVPDIANCAIWESSVVYACLGDL